MWYSIIYFSPAPRNTMKSTERMSISMARHEPWSRRASFWPILRRILSSRNHPGNLPDSCQRGISCSTNSVFVLLNIIFSMVLEKYFDFTFRRPRKLKKIKKTFVFCKQYPALATIFVVSCTGSTKTVLIRSFPLARIPNGNGSFSQRLVLWR